MADDANISAKSILAAAGFIAAAQAEGLEPFEVGVDVMGGLSLHYGWPENFVEGEAERWAWVSCGNSGICSVICRSRDGRSLAICAHNKALAAKGMGDFLRGKT